MIEHKTKIIQCRGCSEEHEIIFQNVHEDNTVTFNGYNFAFVGWCVHSNVAVFIYKT